MVQCKLVYSNEIDSWNDTFTSHPRPAYTNTTKFVIKLEFSKSISNYM